MEERLTEDDWERLAPLAIAGDAEAEARLLMDMRSVAVRYARRLIYRHTIPADADDLGSEAAVALVKHWRTYDETKGVPLRQFMWMVAKDATRNAAFDSRYTRDSFRARKSACKIEDFDPPAREDSDHMASEEVAWLVSVAVMMLPESMREIVADFYGLMGRTPRAQPEIAREIGATQQAVFDRLERAKRRLRKMPVFANRAEIYLT